MNRLFQRNAFLVILLVIVLALPALGQAPKEKIRVVVENASIRVKPDMESDIVGSPAVGDIFEVERKVGDWYEIRFRSEIGLLITGYIYEMFVVLEEEAPKPKKEVKERPVAPRAKPERREPAYPVKRPAGNLKLGLMSIAHSGYEYEFGFPYRDETFLVWDSVDKTDLLGLEVGMGFFMGQNIELEASLGISPKDLTGHYGLSIPSPFFYDLPATDEVEGNPNLRLTLLSFGLLVHPVTSGNFRLYFGGGGTYVSAKIELMEDILYVETLDYDLLTQTVEIRQVTITETKVSKFGFHGKAGIDLMLGTKIALYAEGKYIAAKTEVPHLLTSGLVEDEVIEMDLGGFSFLLGIKVFF